MPVIRTQDHIKGLDPRARFKVVCTDPGTLNDIPAWCRIHGHEVVEIQEKDRDFIFTIQVQK